MRQILYFNGIFLVLLSCAMIFPMLADLYFGYQDWLIFFLCFVLTAFFGGALLLGNTAPSTDLNRKEAFILANITWLTLSIFGAIPFYLSSLHMSLANSFFESVSGLTTTGATVITGLDHTPAGILLWRAILQWLGGIITILMALSILPYLKVGGMHIFRTDFATEDKALPRTAVRSKQILSIYSFLTFLCAMGYMNCGMEVFDAVAHAMTTVSTGGFSTHDHSFMHFYNNSHYNTAGLELIAIVFMLLGAIPFILYLAAAKKGHDVILQDTQVRAFALIFFIFIILIFLSLMLQTHIPHIKALWYATFNAASIITGTGFVNTDYNSWSAFSTTLLLFLMAIGGCAGSTTGGIKIFRFQILYAITLGQIQKLIYPHAIYTAHFNNKPITSDIPISVMGFFFIYAFCFVFLALGLSFTGLDFTTSFSGALSALSNVGPGLGPVIGPLGTYAPLPDPAKWMLSAGMIVGRLELFMVLVMVSPYFWRD